MNKVINKMRNSGGRFFGLTVPFKSGERRFCGRFVKETPRSVVITDINARKNVTLRKSDLTNAKISCS